MSSPYADRIKETSFSTGTGPVTLNGAALGFQSFNSVFGVGPSLSYCLSQEAYGAVQWEVGIGHLSGPATLVRDTVLASSASGALVNLLGPQYDVFCTLPASSANALMIGAGAVMPGGRLTLTSGLPVTSANASGASTVYYTPYTSNVISLWNAANQQWQPVTFTEQSLALSGLVTFQPNDVFGFLSGGALGIEMLPWSSNANVTISGTTVTWNSHNLPNGSLVTFATTGVLPTPLVAATFYVVSGATTNTFSLLDATTGLSVTFAGGSGTHSAFSGNVRATGISLQDGRYCKSSDKTRLLLGTFVPTSATTTEDSQRQRYVANAYNAVPRASKSSIGDTHAYSAVTFREWNAGSGNLPRAFMVAPIATTMQISGVSLLFQNAAVTSSTSVRAYLDAVDTSLTSAQYLGLNVGGSSVPVNGSSSILPGIHFSSIWQSEASGNSVIFLQGFTQFSGLMS